MMCALFAQLVGSPGSGKHSLAHGIRARPVAQEGGKYSMCVVAWGCRACCTTRRSCCRLGRTMAEALPLPEPVDGARRAGLDLVVVLVDARSRLSWSSAQSVLAALHPLYAATGRLMLLLTHCAPG
jgi:hypothetical protein